MKSEDKIYIETYVEKIVSMTVEIGYNVDKFGNIIYKDKEKTIEQLQETLDSISNEDNLNKNELIDYLIEIYNKKSKASKIFQEQNEIKKLLSTIKNMDKEKEDIKVETEKSNGKNNAVEFDEVR